MRIKYSILNILHSCGAKSKLYALSQGDIIEALVADGESWCEKTIYTKLREMVSEGVILEGLKRGNAKTFYIAQKGIDWMKEVQGDNDEEGDVSNNE